MHYPYWSCRNTTANVIFIENFYWIFFVLLAISCFKGNTKICSNDLINLFTQKLSSNRINSRRSKEAKHHLQSPCWWQLRETCRKISRKPYHSFFTWSFFKAVRTVLAITIAPMMGAPCICLLTNCNIFSKTPSFLRTNTEIYHSYSSKRRLCLSTDGWQSWSESSMF